MSLLDTASLIVTPNGYKEGKLYSVIPSDGSGDMSVVRATTATRVNSAGLVELVPYNLATYSEDATQWLLSSIAGTMTVTANQTISPDGTLNADKIQFPAVSLSDSFAVFYYEFTAIASDYSTSFYLKGDVGGEVVYIMYTPDGVTYTRLACTLTTSWQRFTLTSNLSSGTSYFQLGVDRRDSSQTARPAQTIYAWGRQLVEGSTAKDYQKTETRLNIPRLDYSNGTCPSLLVEPQRTNLWYYSEQFDNAEWLKTELTVTANSVISPDGTQNADKITDTTANNEHRIRATSSLFIITTATTLSIFAKAAEYTRFAIANLSSSEYVKFNLSTGSVISTGANFSNAKIENYGNGWYRLSATTSTSGTYGYGLLNDAGDFTFTGTGTKGVYIWGAQAELGSYPTSYIPTTSASVTRNADVISKTGISSLIGQTEGTMFVDIYYDLTSAIGTASARFQLTDGSTDKWIFVSTPDAGTQQARFYVNNNGSEISFYSATDLLQGRNKVAVGYKSGQYVMYLNGVLSNSSTSSVVVPATSRLDFSGNVPSDPTVIKSNFNAAALWKTRLTNDQLAQLTSI